MQYSNCNINLTRLVRLCFSVSLFFLCLFYVYVYFDWALILFALAKMELTTFGVGCLFVPVYWFFRMIRWSLFLRFFSIHVNCLELYTYTAISLSLGALTPLQLGELIRLRFASHPQRELVGLAIITTEKLLDLGVVLCFSLLAWPAATPIAFICLCLAPLFWLLLAAGLRLIPLPSLLAPVEPLLSMPVRLFAAALACSVGGWLMIALGWLFTLRSIGLSISPQEVISFMGQLTLINVLSIVPGAVGVSEVSAAILLAQHGDVAQAGAISLRIFGIFSILFGLAHLPLLRIVKRPVITPPTAQI